MGFFRSVGQGWTFMKQALAMGFKERKLFKPSIYLVLTTIVYFVVWAFLFVGLNLTKDNGTTALFGSIATFGSFLIFYFFCGVTVNMVDVYLKGGTPSVGEGMRDAGKNFAAIAFLALISTIVNMFTRAIRRRGRGGAAVIGAIIAGIIETVWTVLTFLLLPAIIIEDLSLGAALRRTRDIYKRNLLTVGIGEVGVRFVTGLISFFAIWVIIGLTYLSIKITGTGAAGVVIAIMVFGTLLSLLAAFNTFVRMSYYTCMFLWAVEVEKVGQTARAPLPLAIALKQVPAPA